MPTGRSRRPASASPSTRRSRTGSARPGLFEHYSDRELHRLPRSTPRRKIVEIPKPAGVIFALTPSTNPVCSVFYKAILALLTRNAIVICPHPDGKGLLRRRGAAHRQRGGRGGRAGRHHPGHRRAVAADHRDGHEVRPHRPDPRDRRLADGARRLFAPAIRRSASGPGNNPAYVDETADVAQGGEGDRRLRRPSTIRSSAPTKSAVIAHAAIARRLARGAEAPGLPHAVAPRSATGSRSTSSRTASSTSRSSASRPRRSPRAPASGCRAARGSCSCRSSGSATTIR